MEESKIKSSRRDSLDKEESKTSHHREERSREKERKHEKHKERDRDRDRHRKREDSVDETYKDQEKHKSRRHEKEHEREKMKSYDDGVRDVGRSREKSREDRDVERDRDRDKDRLRDREREHEKQDREKEGEREKEQERELERRYREKEREKERERKEKEKRGKHRDRSYSSDDDVRVHERKRHRRDSDYQNSEKNTKSKRHRDEDQESSPRRKGDGEYANEETTTRRMVDGESAMGAGITQEEAIAEEQKRLDEEMEKRRRRVQEWQEQRRTDQSEKEKPGEAVINENKSGKAWTLEGESDDEDDGPEGKVSNDVDDDDDALMPNGEDANVMAVDLDNEAVPPVQGDAAADDEIDPLDAFMNSMVLPEVEKLNKSVSYVSSESRMDVADTNGKTTLENVRKAARKGLIMPSEDSDSDYGDIENEGNPMEDEDDEEFMKRVKNSKVEKLSIVDHSKIDYPPFRKKFYSEVKEISRMTPEEVAAYRKQLELKIHGKDVPKPVKTWHQTGLSTKILDTIRKLNYERPMPIQAQALPVIMSGRDCIGIAKTGSGKTLAFVLPMLRHIKDQPPLASGDGPIGLILAPTRELVQQIYRDIKKISKGMGLICVPIYGGSGVAQQIGELKRGAEIVVCTPGRMIAILCTSSGKITNLRRVTYLVMDEADRMFDMGFEPQITRIVQNTRPDRQTVLFSATFPRQVEVLARKVLTKPVELQVGGRSVVNKDITQLVELRPESERFNRLLEILGEWYEKGKTLIFVHTQDKCDALFRDLLRHGYPCLSLHGAKDQTDRESTIADFKADICNILVATSIAARGLDVKELELVVNYDAPNHYEDYVHRVGRTGRAGRKGFAITFITEEDERYAPDLVKALELSEQPVPEDLKSLADKFMAKVNQGLEQAHGTGFGGRGFKFNEEEDEVRKAAKKAQAKEYGFEEDKSDSEEENETVKKVGPDLTHQAALAQVAALAAASKANLPSLPSTPQLLPNGGGFPMTLPGGVSVTLPGVAAAVSAASGGGESAARAAALAAAMNLQHNLAKIHADAMPEHYTAELEINDFPQNARWRVTHKDTLGPISDWTGAAITTRGQYFPPGKVAGAGDRKLYLFIEGSNEQSVKRAKAELKRVLEDITNHATSLPGSAQPGRYSVL